MRSRAGKERFLPCFVRKKVCIEMERKTIQASQYASHIMGALRRGILVCTMHQKFNAMVLTWGFMGRVWGRECFSIYVRDRQYTKTALDETGEFCLCIPLSSPDADVLRIAGTKSGRNLDKEGEIGLPLYPARSLHTPVLPAYPLTLECKVIYKQRQDISALPEEVQRGEYLMEGEPLGREGVMGGCTLYIGQIMDAYILQEDA